MPNSKIKEIAIYRNGCFIRRNGTVRLEKGRHTVTLDYLPFTLDSSTLTLSLPEELSGSNVQVERLDEEKQEEITAELKKKLRQLENAIGIKRTQIEMWNANADFSAKDSLNIEEMSAYIEKLPQRLEKLYSEIEELEEEKKKLNKELSEKNKEVNVFAVKADVETKEDGEYPFALRYLDRNASWYPGYEVHTTEENDLSILLKAGIVQNTPEDMKQVKVSLFTSNPTVSAQIPELGPNRLNFYQPNLFKSARKMAAVGAMADAAAPMEVEYEEAAEYSMNDVVNTVGTARQDDTMTEYELTGLWDLESGKEISADISLKKVSCRYHVVAVPKLDDCAYLAAEVATADIEELISTSAKIYHKGTYIGEVFLDPDLDKEKYDISLGRDETIKLKREQKRKYTSTVLLKNQKKTEYEYELKVTSAKKRPFPVTLIDQIPVSQDKSITVDAVDISKAELDEDTGKLVWEFEIQPQENKVIDLAYNVSWPKDRQINI